MSGAYDKYHGMVEAALADILPQGTAQLGSVNEPPRLLMDSMRYSLLAGGKRLRPVLMMAVVDMLGGDTKMAIAPACAVEMIHTYSLVHDDLPGMDDDVLRRGRPTNHVVYGVGQATLAGDGLLTHAFELMLSNALAYPECLARHVKAMRAIAGAAGVGGMVGGQSTDLLCERGAGEESQSEIGQAAKSLSAIPREQLLRNIHRLKTGALIRAPLEAGALLCGADDHQLAAVCAFGDTLGALFQATDDLLDVVGDEQALGKSTGKDAHAGKLTSVALYGIEGTRARIAQLEADALAALTIFGDAAAFFRELTVSLGQRDR